MKVYPKGGMLVLEDTVDTNERVIEKAEQNKAEVEKWISCHSPLNSPSFQLNHSFLRTRKGRKSRLSIVKEPWATSKDMEELQALHGELLEFISTLAISAPAQEDKKVLDPHELVKKYMEEETSLPIQFRIDKETKTVVMNAPIYTLLLMENMIADFLHAVVKNLKDEGYAL